MELWNNAWCGTNYGPTFEIRTQDNERRNVTSSYNPAYRGDTLEWNTYNGKLGRVSLLKVSGDYIRFTLFGQSGDEFCPKRFVVQTYDGTRYQSFEMEDWVNSSKGNQQRFAYKDVNILEI